MSYSLMASLARLSPPAPPEHPRSKSSPDYYYFVVTVAAIAVMLVVSNVIAFACCSPCVLIRNFRRRFSRDRSATERDRGRDRDRSQELIPVCQYKKDQAYGTECSVCLTGFIDGEEVRQLPVCKHSFHAPCIDMWLCSHSSCPLCRASVAVQPPPPPPPPPQSPRTYAAQQQHVMAATSSVSNIIVNL